MSELLLDSVKSKYGAVAESTLSSDHAGVKAVAEAFGYSPGELTSIPAEANMGLSCGNPTATANLRPGEVVVDLGSAAALSGAAGAALGVLRDALHVNPGDRVLIRGANGGVGVAAIQIAQALGGKVTALTRESQFELVRRLGAERVFDYKTCVPADLGRFEVIVDPVAKNTRSFRRLLAPGGRMGVMALGSLSEILYMFASVIFGERRVRFVTKPPDHALLRDLAAMVESGSLVPVVDKVYPMEQTSAAHAVMERGGLAGKCVVEIK